MTVAKIMLIDDDESLSLSIRRLMEQEGYDFCSYESGRDALEALDHEKPDLILLDVMMPLVNGFDVCARVRERGCLVPVIFLSAKSDIVDKSMGFRAGGDDYVVKPFSADELLLRIEAHLRRQSYGAAAQTAESREKFYRVGDMEVRFDYYEVRLRGEPVKLTAKEFEIVALLAGKPGQVFTREQIYEHIWGDDANAGESTITVFMRRIREKIEDNPSKPAYLLTVWGIDYKFAEVE